MPDTGADQSPRRFAPGWPLWLFTLGFLPILLGLGFWQLDRAEQKSELQTRMEQRREAPPLALEDISTTRDPAWRRLQLTGQFDPGYIWLLDNRTRNGQAGVEVLQLFHAHPGNQPLIINRGWLPWPDRRHLPGVPTAEGLLQLEAEVVAEAEPGFRLRGASTQGWPRLITHLDPAVLADHLDLDPPPLIARLQPGSAAALRLEWPALSMSPSKHTGYAVQWFTMAAALLALFFWAGYHRPVSGGNNNNDEHI